MMWASDVVVVALFRELSLRTEVRAWEKDCGKMLRWPETPFLASHGFLFGCRENG